MRLDEQCRCYGMGCMASSQGISVVESASVNLLGLPVDNHVASRPWFKLYDSVVRWQGAMGKAETIAAALTRFDHEIEASEKLRPIARLSVVSAEIDSLQKELKLFEGCDTSSPGKECYAKVVHQVFVSLDVYRRPVLASENEDLIANINRKEMHRLELEWLRDRREELLRERRGLHAQILRARALHAQQLQLLESVWGTGPRPGPSLEEALTRAVGLRDALSAVSARLHGANDYAHAAQTLVESAVARWKLNALAKSGWERTVSCADACSLVVRARCAERGARRVLAAPAAPRAARALRLALEYAFTDALHDHKYQRAMETFLQFQEALGQLISSIHQVLLTNLENLAAADKDVASCRRELRAVRINALVRQGLAEMQYQPRALTTLKSNFKPLG